MRILLFIAALMPVGLAVQSAPADETTAELVLQTGHSDTITSLAFSADGRLLASGSFDRTVRLWSVESGHEIRTLAGHHLQVQSVAFGRRGELLASGSWDKTAKLWDVRTGKEIGTFLGHEEWLQAVALSPDEELVATLDMSGVIRVWRTDRQDLLAQWGPDKNLSTVFSLVFSPDGNLLAAGRHVWDARSGHRVLSLPDQARVLLFSPDGRPLLSLRGDITFVDPVSGSQFPAVNVLISRLTKDFRVGGDITLWDAKTARKLRTLPRGDASMHLLSFSADGRTIVGGTDDGRLIFWEADSGRLVRTLAGHGHGVDALAVGPDGSVASAAKNEIKLWKQGESAGRTLRGSANAVTTVTVSPDGQTVAVGLARGVKLWSTSGDKPIRSLAGSKGESTSLAFSSDSRFLAAGTDQGEVEVWGVNAGTHILGFKGDQKEVRGVAFSPDGAKLASIGQDGVARIWSVPGGREVARLQDAGSNAVAFSPDGGLLATAGALTRTVVVWDLAAQVEVLTLTADGIVNALAFSPDGQTLAAGTWNNAVTIWDSKSGKEIRRLGASRKEDAFMQQGKLMGDKRARELEAGFMREGVTSVAFSPDGQSFAAASKDGTVRVWNARDGSERIKVTAHSREVTGLAFAARGRFFVTGSPEGQAKIWDARQGTELASLVTLGESDWLVATPQGLFDGSPAAWTQILWRFGGDTQSVAPVEIFFNEFFFPGLLSEIWRGHVPTPPKGLTQVDRRQPTVGLLLGGSEGASAGPIGSRTIPVRVVVAEVPSDAQHPRGSGAKDVRLFRNGSLVNVWRGDVLKGAARATLEATVPIEAGDDRLTAYAFNNDNIKSTDAELIVKGAESLKRPGTAWILAIGINRYADERFELNYAVADAQDFAQTLQAEQQKLGRYREIKVVSLTDAEATKANILGALARLSRSETGGLRPGAPRQLAELRPAQPEDAVFIYYAGHGAAPGHQSRRFYLIAHEFEPPAEEQSAASAKGVSETLAGTVNDLELGQALEKIDAGEMVLVIDACQSGKTLESDDPRHGPMNSQGLAQLAYEKGMNILAAAQGDQAAKELSQLGHGLLTYALVEEGLKQAKADYAPQDGQIVLREWLDYTTQRLPQLQLEGMQRLASLGRDVPIVNGEDKIKELERRSLQRPRVFYRREPEEHPFIVAKPEMR